MINNTQNNNNIINIESNSKQPKQLANLANTTNSLRVEPLHNANQQVTDSLIERMINSQEEKVNPAVSTTKDGVLDLKEGHIS